MLSVNDITARGHGILVEARISDVIALDLYLHHEKIDGTGYPSQLTGQRVVMID
jgi:HD-GYP domain-containing protein (c-di-GMP phosphodiesterase class II)